MSLMTRGINLDDTRKVHEHAHKLTHTKNLHLHSKYAFTNIPAWTYVYLVYRCDDDWPKRGNSLLFLLLMASAVLLYGFFIEYFFPHPRIFSALFSHSDLSM
jgi:hypothetical protein